MFIVCEKSTGNHWYIAFSRPLADAAAGELRKRGMLPLVEKYNEHVVSCLINTWGWHSHSVSLETAYKVASAVSQFSTEECTPYKGEPESLLNEAPCRHTDYGVCCARYQAQCRYFPSIMQDFSQFLLASSLASKEGFVYPEVAKTALWSDIRRLLQQDPDITWDTCRGRDRIYAYGVPLYARYILARYWQTHAPAPAAYQHPLQCPVCARVWAVPHIKECPVCGTVLA